MANATQQDVILHVAIVHTTSLVDIIAFMGNCLPMVTPSHTRILRVLQVHCYSQRRRWRKRFGFRYCRWHRYSMLGRRCCRWHRCSCRELRCCCRRSRGQRFWLHCRELRCCCRRSRGQRFWLPCCRLKRGLWLCGRQRRHQSRWRRRRRDFWCCRWLCRRWLIARVGQCGTTACGCGASACSC